MLVKKFNIPIYDQTMVLVIYNRKNEKKKVIEKYEVTEDDLDGWAASVLTKGGFTIFMEDKAPQEKLVHELVHIKNEIYKHIGAKIDHENDEHEAYLMSFLFKKTSKYVKPVRAYEKKIKVKEENEGAIRSKE